MLMDVYQSKHMFIDSYTNNYSKFAQNLPKEIIIYGYQI